MEVLDNMIMEVDFTISTEIGVIAYFVDLVYVPMFSVEISYN
jgi:hypothetical protein